ncbi:dTDP-4-dehydrorhamnose reductase [candidate division KSB1 bacterium]|nr:dTDP-4-dehydrorhamnose reductase [candidate division KSB1 bacterium]
MKILITGCHGLLGQRLVKFAPPGCTIVATDVHADHQFTSPEIYRPCDLTDRDAVKELIDTVAPDNIINTAAFTNVDAAEEQRDLCWLVNVIAMENLVQAARRVHAGIYHLSTDYIFNGQNGPYRENDTPNPLGFYGQSKLAAEMVLKGSPLNFTIARTMVLFGHSVNKRPDFVGWLISKLRNGDPVHIVTDQIGNTTLNDDLARALWHLVRTSFHGVIHLAGREIISRFDFAHKVARIFNLDPSLINPISTADFKQRAPRPLNSGLVVDKAIYTLGLELSDAEGGLRKYKAVVENESV